MPPGPCDMGPPHSRTLGSAAASQLRIQSRTTFLQTSASMTPPFLMPRRPPAPLSQVALPRGSRCFWPSYGVGVFEEPPSPYCGLLEQPGVVKGVPGPVPRPQAVGLRPFLSSRCCGRLRRRSPRWCGPNAVPPHSVMVLPQHVGDVRRPSGGPWFLRGFPGVGYRAPGRRGRSSWSCWHCLTLLVRSARGPPIPLSQLSQEGPGKVGIRGVRRCKVSSYSHLLRAMVTSDMSHFFP